jgi:FlaA1/EpsC-like NDP-sugar epimerase
MTIKEASELVIQASSLSKGGDVFLLDMGEPIKIFELAKKMIQLSGAEIKNIENPNGEIEIIFTGKRPGEKIYEELLIDAKAEGTSHPLILRAKEKLIEPDLLWKIIKKLEDAIDKQEKEKVLFCLSELVPEWDPYTKEKDLSSSF